MSRRRRPQTDYEIGYGKPPVHTRFEKGRSGNPRGRPKGTAAGRLAQILEEEAFRLITVRDGERTARMPAIQAVLRSQLAQAAKGNGAAGRVILQALQATRDTTSSIEAETNAEPPSNDKMALALLKILDGAAER